jgi:glycosyltransferase involved in cell wall biosynthesis
MDVIFNGVEADKFGFDFPPEEAGPFRAQYAATEEKLLFFVGRGTHEKGAHVLIDALPKVRAQYHDAKVIIVGGGNKDHLIRQANSLGIGRHVYFTGFVPDDVLLRIYKVIDVACFPSLYEPFGIVALEAMAAGVPVVVTDAGGLKEVVEHDVSGLVTWAGNSDSLAWGIVRMLKDPAHARWMAGNALRRVHEVFNWDRIAGQTQATYDRVWSEYCASEW